MGALFGVPSSSSSEEPPHDPHRWNSRLARASAAGKVANELYNGRALQDTATPNLPGIPRDKVTVIVRCAHCEHSGLCTSASIAESHLRQKGASGTSTSGSLYHKFASKKEARAYWHEVFDAALPELTTCQLPAPIADNN